MKHLPSTAMRSNGADYQRTYHHVTVSPEVALDDILRPGFWAFHTNNVNVRDLVDVITEDLALDVQLRVVEKGVGFVTMRPLRVYEAEGRSATLRKEAEADKAELPDLPEGYKVSWAGPSAKYRVATSDPHLVVSEKHDSKLKAHRAAIAHAQKTGAAA